MNVGNANPHLPHADLVVLDRLFADIQNKRDGDATRLAATKVEKSNGSPRGNHLDNDTAAISHLQAINNPKNADFQPSVFVGWDERDIPVAINTYLIRPYVRLATSIVRHPTDVVFLTHIIQYFAINVPSAIYLFRHFTYIHGILHALYTLHCAGSFTLMMHNHIHNNGVLSKSYAGFDYLFPYVLEPLMGHTWDSYYYHHVKHHHVEGNGPDDLSSTIRYQRDNVWHFLHYVFRFLLFVWIELPLYFIRKNKPGLALRSFAAEMASYAFLYLMTTRFDARAATFTLLIPFVQMRLGLMIGNWGQHALVDEVEPDSDFRSSITLIDVPSNRYCFNDGYHTAHHLNPRRHWREHPVHFLQSKDAYIGGRALVFHNIDYLMMTFTLLRQDYMHLAKCLVPIGDQVHMSQVEIADMLRTKTRQFTEADIRKKFK